MTIEYNSTHFEEQLEKKKSYNILFCSDFTVPKTGGVEMHGYQLS